MAQWVDSWVDGCLDGRMKSGQMAGGLGEWMEGGSRLLEGHLMDRWLVGRLARGRIV